MIEQLPDELRTDLATALLDRQCSQPIPVMKNGITYYVSCGSRLAEVCPYCSKLAVGDWAAIIRDGVYDAGPGYRWYLLTLTAPSFGRVHRVPKSGDSPRRCACGRTHTDADAHVRGLPVDPDSYDYGGAVRWNRDSSRLWDNTMRELRRAMPGLTYAVVREWQARGSLHYHALLRVPGAEALPPEAIESLASSVTAAGLDGDLTEWGAQVDARTITADGSTAKLIWYLTKAVGYLVKSVADGGVSSPEALKHAARLDDAASSWSMRCPRCQDLVRLGAARCQAPAHRRWGALSHVVSVSRPTKERAGWSLNGLTRASQRAKRAEWAKTPTETAAASKRRADTSRWARTQLGYTFGTSATATDPPF